MLGGGGSPNALRCIIGGEGGGVPKLCTISPRRHPDCAMLTPNQIDLRNKLGYSTAHHSLIEEPMLDVQ